MKNLYEYGIILLESFFPKGEFTMSVTVITEDNFEAEVLQADKPVLVDFWATWCGPCQRLSPLVEQVAQENDHIKVCKIDTDECPDIARKYGIMSIPTLMVFKEGDVTATNVGVIPKEKILALVNG